MPQVALIVKELGTRYAAHCDQYALSISLNGNLLLSVDNLLPERFPARSRAQLERAERLRAYCEREKLKVDTPVYLHFARRMYRGQNCYTAFSCNGIFDISDTHVPIVLPPETEMEYRALGLKKYITLNAGAGEGKDSSLVSKCWPVSYWEKLAELLHSSLPDVEIVQLGASDTVPLKGADRLLLGRPFGLVGQILKHSLLHVDIEGGLVHLASQLGTKCAVLFGPTPMEYLAYPDNINIRSEICCSCYGLYADVSVCAKGFVPPACMRSIEAERVAEEISAYFRKEASR